MPVPNPRVGAFQRVVIGKEDTFGAGQATVKGLVVPFGGTTFDAFEQAPAESPELRADANPPIPPSPGFKDSSGELTLMAALTFLPVLQKLLTGNLTSTGASAPYVHTSKIGADAQPSLWLERGDVQNTKYKLYKGIRIAGFSLNALKEAQHLALRVNLVGMGDEATESGTPYDAAPVSFQTTRLVKKDMLIKVDTVTSGVAISLDTNPNRTQEQLRVLDGLYTAAQIAAGPFKIPTTLTGIWDSLDALRGLCDGAAHVVEILTQLTGDATRYFSVKFPEAYFKKTTAWGVTGPGALQATVAILPCYAVNADTTAMKMVTTNDNNTTYYGTTLGV